MWGRTGGVSISFSQVCREPQTALKTILFENLQKQDRDSVWVPSRRHEVGGCRSEIHGGAGLDVLIGSYTDSCLADGW